MSPPRQASTGTELLRTHAIDWPAKTLVYLDPPYFEKGPELYYNFYRPDDHSEVAEVVRKLETARWIVSYDDVVPIHHLYTSETWLQYQIGYSARNRTKGREAMFFSSALKVPPVQGSMIELDRWEPTACETSYRAALVPVNPSGPEATKPLPVS